jgi:hypothetical protein
MSFSIPSGYAPSENTHCFVDLTFFARNADAAEGSGYTDTQHVSLQFFVPAAIEESGAGAPASLIAPSPSAPLLDEATVGGEGDATSTPVDGAAEEVPATTTEEIVPPPSMPEVPAVDPVISEPASTDPPPAA